MKKSSKIIIVVIVSVVLILLSVVIAGVTDANPATRSMINTCAGMGIIAVIFSLFGKRKKNNNNSSNDLTLRK